MGVRAGGELKRAVSRFAVVSVLGGMAAGCSTDSMRFTENPFSNPFATASTDTPPADAVAAQPRRSVSSAPLAPSAQSHPARSVRTASAGGWTAKGGTPITVALGDTLPQIADRYGVPAGAILSANGLSAAQVVPGRALTIPVYTTAAAPPAAAPQPVAPRVVATAKLPAPAAKPAVVAEAPRHVRPGTATRVAAAEPAPLPATTGSVQPKTRVRPGQKPAVETAEAAKPAPAKIAKAEPAPKVGAVVKSEPLPARPSKVAAAPAKAEPKAARAEPTRTAKVEAKPSAKGPDAKTPDTKVAIVAPAKPAKEIDSTGTLPASPAPAPSAAEFRWPAKGRVISGFGGGGSNEGINIAVPDGTPVKAAESGTVAYAGSEVKGYGNLVLIKHDNGYVSAYAHNGEIEVKRGQRVSRGQVVAKSGQSGNVTSPQLHFELRKGSTPVDPTPLLASN